MKTKFIPLIFGCLIGYLAGYWIHGRPDSRSSAEIAAKDGKTADALSRNSALPDAPGADQSRHIARVKAKLDASTQKVAQLEARIRQNTLEEAKREEKQQAALEAYLDSNIGNTLNNLVSAKLTSEQERKIKDYLKEYWTYRYHYKEADPEEREGLVKPEMDPQEAISAILNEEQRTAYQEELDREMRGKFEAVSTKILSDYPVSFGFSEEQKDRIYSNLYHSFGHKETRQAFESFAKEFNQANEAQYRHEDLLRLWAAKDFLTQAQFEQLASSMKQLE